MLIVCVEYWAKPNVLGHRYIYGASDYTSAEALREAFMQAQDVYIFEGDDLEKAGTEERIAALRNWLNRLWASLIQDIIPNEGE